MTVPYIYLSVNRQPAQKTGFNFHILRIDNFGKKRYKRE